ncbi:preprotein translocase subunit SecA [Patescibacteria group bacterium]
MGLFTRILGDPNKKELKKLQPKVDSINKFENRFKNYDREAAIGRITEIKKDLSSNPNKINDYLDEVFALVRQAAVSTIGLRHYDVQLIGGIVLHQGKIAEMRTGEGKTLVASLALTLNALTGKGSHLITVNDYLARRDAGWMGPIYNYLGLSVGIIIHDSAFLFDPEFTDEKHEDPRLSHLRPVERLQAYQADITYGTNNEFGFDYLRDNMVPTLKHKVMRQLNFAIVDEVDSILVDEARTPLIISAPSDESAELYERFAKIVPQLNELDDYNIDEKMRAVTLTDGGIEKVEKILGLDNIYQAGGVELVHHLEQALKANTLFHKDKEYVIKDGEIVIVDEFTGRLMFGRRFSEGLHQAIEAKENVEIKKESRTLATISFQNYFRMYDKLSGMTGTAVTEAEEFAKIYDLSVVLVPTNKPMIRNDMTDVIYKTELGKLKAIVREVKRRNEIGQPVLIGTISIEKNELLGGLLEREGVHFEALNAKKHEQEAGIITKAGIKGAVTLATNIAGRGVDIVLGGPNADQKERQDILSLSGLHVIGTERHESRRIDNQLRGRSGRQGDPGSSQFFISMEDDLMRIFGSDRMKNMMDRMGIPDDMPIENKLIAKSIETAQKKVEGHNFDIRKHLVEYDDVMNKHREVVYKKRNDVLKYKDDQLRQEALGIINTEIEQIVSFHTNQQDKTWDLDEIYESVDALFPIPLEVRIKMDDLEKSNEVKKSVEARDKIISYISNLAVKAYEDIESAMENNDMMRNIERGMMLRIIDSLWTEHLDQMSYLRQGIGLRGYAQRDPLVEYKKDAFQLFTQLLNSINSQFAHSIYKIVLAKDSINKSTPEVRHYKHDNVSMSGMAETGQVDKPINQNEVSGQATDDKYNKVGRNDPCPCGSGKKYKKCHGR